MDIEKDPEECMVNVRKQFIKLAKSGAVVSLFAFKADFDVKRRKARARLEDTRHAMMTRIADLKSGDADVEEQITALYKVANAMAHVVNALLPLPIDGARSVATRCDAVEDYLASLLAEEDARFDRAVNASTEASSAKAAHLALKVHAYDRALARLERDHLREYAAAERVADLAVLGQKYRALRARQSALSTEVRRRRIESRADDDAIERRSSTRFVAPPAEDEDARDAVDGLARASAGHGVARAMVSRANHILRIFAIARRRRR
jgi:cell division protein FtsB